MSHKDTPRRPRTRLRGELIVALLLKLAVLLLIKHAFFPARMPAEAAWRGVAERIAQPESAGTAPRGKTPTKESE
jgi:hypothetical protein